MPQMAPLSWMYLYYIFVIFYFVVMIWNSYLVISMVSSEKLNSGYKYMMKGYKSWKW